jgi:hypothetical protein
LLFPCPSLLCPHPHLPGDFFLFFHTQFKCHFLQTMILFSLSVKIFPPGKDFETWLSQVA